MKDNENTHAKQAGTRGQIENVNGLKQKADFCLQRTM